ncbi:MAG: TetR-like C-terminal domain-containing protein, partial [Actinomycetota bacterium]
QAGALLEAYVEFALENPGLFRVMFRSDLCDIENAPDLMAVADGAFDVLVDHVRAQLGEDASINDIRARATAMWSLAHGLATLFIEGPLQEKIGPIADRRAFIRAVGKQSGLA